MTNQYKPRKPGLYDRTIQVAKHDALLATYRSSPRAKTAILSAMYGGTQDKRFEPMRVLKARGLGPLDVFQTPRGYTEHGDFNHLQSTPGVHF